MPKKAAVITKAQENLGEIEKGLKIKSAASVTTKDGEPLPPEARLPAPLLKVLERAEASLDGNLEEVMGVYNDVRDLHEGYKYISARFSILEDALESRIIASADDKGIGAITCHGFTFNFSRVIHASFLDSKKGFAWLRKNKMKEAIKETIHWKTLSSFVTQRVVANKSIPEFVRWDRRPSISRRKKGVK